MNRVSRHLLIVLFVIVIIALPSVASATMQEEITHLLNYIELSDCVFIRNNSRYNSEEAERHIAKKYNYIKKRIKSTEDFINGAATRSSMSGKQYTVICDGIELATADWLRIELKKYRLK